MVETLRVTTPTVQRLGPQGMTGITPPKKYPPGISLKKCPSRSNKKPDFHINYTFFQVTCHLVGEVKIWITMTHMSWSIKTYSPRHTSSMPRGRFTPLKLRQ